VPETLHRMEKTTGHQRIVVVVVVVVVVVCDY